MEVVSKIFLCCLLASISHAFAPLRNKALVGPSLAGNFRHPNVLKYQNGTSTDDVKINLRRDPPLDRFHREAATKQEIETECIVTIHGSRYNMSAWANAHPGGAKILQKFHDRDASKAFEAAHHSTEAYAMLKDFYIDDVVEESDEQAAISRQSGTTIAKSSGLRRARRKLFTKEDPIGIHKYLGIFSLLNFIGRYSQMYFGDPAAGLGSRGHPYFSMLCLIPHGVLSVSSLIFHTVPIERVVGKPMIWQEYRVHNILFGLRSVICTLVTSLTVALGHNPIVRKAAIMVCGATVLLANYGADIATTKLRKAENESTTATMPYWEGCSMETQRRFKSFYAYCQFMATLACLTVANPAFPFSVLLAIQMASLLMTLVRKGLLSARGYHYGYTATLVAPWFVGFRHVLKTGSPEFAMFAAVGYGLYMLRRKGVDKYSLWAPVVAARFLFGDMFINYGAW